MINEIYLKSGILSNSVILSIQRFSVSHVNWHYVKPLFIHKMLNLNIIDQYVI